MILTGLNFWLNFRIDNIIDKKTYSNLVNEIETSQDLPSRFYKFYFQVTGSDGNLTTKKFLFYKTVALLSNYNLRKAGNICPCFDASYGITFNTIDNWTVGLALEKDVSPKKCLDYYLSKFYFPYSVKGIQEASKFYYKKDLEQLSDNEMIEISIMTLNPSFYNKIRNPEKLKEKVRQIKKQIKEHEI